MTSDYLGVDPGLSGGFAVVYGDKIRYKMVMPTLSFTKSDGKTKTKIDREGVLSFLSTLPPRTYVAIEEQTAFRGQNIVSTCTQCKNYGMILMALSVAHMYITEVHPSVWQAHFGIVSAKEGKGTTKEQAYHIARELYPDANFRKSERSHIVHDGMVDATLIAKYGQSRFAPNMAPHSEPEKGDECKVPGTKRTMYQNGREIEIVDYYVKEQEEKGRK